MSHFSLVQGALKMNETRLHKELFKGYNTDTHPKLPGTGPVMVTFDFQLIGILDVVSLYTTLALTKFPVWSRLSLH